MKKYMLALLFSLLLTIILYYPKKEEPMPPIKLNLSPTMLSPTLVYPGTEWYKWDQINTPNTFAASGRKGFGFATLDTALRITYTPVKEGFPGIGTSFNATDDGTILWGKEGYRALWAIDVASGNTIERDIFVNDGSSEIYEGWQCGEGKLLVQTSFPRDDYSLTGSSRAYYDVKNGIRERVEEDYDNPNNNHSREYLTLIPDSNDFYYVQQQKWLFTKLTFRGFEGYYENKLTQQMSKTGFSTLLWTQDIKQWDIPRRYIFGQITLPQKISFPNGYHTTQSPTVVHWDEEMEDIKITPLFSHIPDGYRVIGAWAVSPNGEWARCGIKSIDFSDKTYYTCFFHLDDKYPNGVSMGVLGESSLQMHGIFVEHEELGTLYLDRPGYDEGGYESKYPGAILVYKMSDFFKPLAEVMIEKGGF